MKDVSADSTTQTDKRAFTAVNPQRTFRFTTKQQDIKHYSAAFTHRGPITFTQTHMSKSKNSSPFNLYETLKPTREDSKLSHLQPVREILGICIDKVLLTLSQSAGKILSSAQGNLWLLKTMMFRKIRNFRKFNKKSKGRICPHNFHVSHGESLIDRKKDLQLESDGC